MIMKAFYLFCALVLWVITAYADESKWHPGHYIWLNQTADQSMYNRLMTNSKYLGVMYRVTWPTIDKGNGRYDFTFIDEKIAQARAANKFVGFALEDKTWEHRDGHVACTPPGVASTWSGGTRGSCAANRWEASVADAYIAYIKAIGARYDSNPTVVMFQTTESALPQLPPQYRADYATQYKRVIAAFGEAFPKTTWAMSVNWALGPEAPIVDAIKAAKGGLSHPDTVPKIDGKAHDPYSANYFNDDVIRAPAAELTFITYQKNIFDGKTMCGDHLCTMDDYIDSAVVDLRANYVFWTGSRSGAYDPFPPNGSFYKALEDRGWPIDSKYPYVTAPVPEPEQVTVHIGDKVLQCK